MNEVLTSVNKSLLVSNEHFEDQYNNVDSLISLSSKEYDVRRKLKILLRAVRLVDRLHSYFHFEESFVYTLLGDIYFNNLPKKAICYYKSAIFQDHLNNYAHFQLIRSYKRFGDKEMLQNAVKYKESLGIKAFKIEKPVRPHIFLQDYIKFITMNKILPKGNVTYLGTCWEYLDDFKRSNVDRLKMSIEDIKQRHRWYHKEAALVYYNIYQVYMNIKEFSLAKNAFEKIRNLDNITFCKREI